MDEVIGQRFAIVGETALLEHLRPDSVLLPGVGQEWLTQHSVRAALLRPDRYVFAVAA
jgi:3-(3-hydroxy-phenyl)propionate hydroxylase